MGKPLKVSRMRSFCAMVYLRARVMSKRCAADKSGLLEISEEAGVQAWDKLSGSGRLKKKKWPLINADERG